MTEPIDVTKLTPEEIADAVGWIAEEHDRNPAHRTKRHAFALASTMAAMLEQGPVRWEWCYAIATDWYYEVTRELAHREARTSNGNVRPLYALPNHKEPTE